MADVTVRVRTGTLVGNALEGCNEFLGVPYAAAPLGAAAFLPPSPLPSSIEAVVCQTYGASAPRPIRPGGGFIPEPVVAGPNCLNLNLWAPSPSPGGLPVFVWIHGGGFTGGSNASPWYRGERFARDGVILVAINYRLGPEGFLWLDEDNANRGILDMLAALEWIQENIAAFGGDPASVTIGGQSAGASACLTLLTSPVASGYFSRTAIESSGGMLPASPAEAEAMSRHFATSLGVDLDAEALGSLSAERRQAVDPEYLPSPAGRRPGFESTTGADAWGKESLTWRPALDDRVVSGDAFTLARAGRAHGSALLIGTTAEEFNGAIAVAASSMDDGEITAALGALGLGQGAIERYRAFGIGRGSLAWALGQAFTDWRFRVPAEVMADAATAGGLEVFKFEFRFTARLPGPGAFRVQHCADIPFVFDNLSAEGVPKSVGEDVPQRLADEMHGAWVDFITGDKPPWARYAAPERTTMLFEAGSRPDTSGGVGLATLWGTSEGSAGS